MSLSGHPDHLSAPIFDRNPMGSDASSDVVRLMSALWRAKFWIVLPALLFAGFAFLVLSGGSPIYVSEGQILVENRESGFTQPVQGQGQSQLGSDPLDEAAIRSQVELLQSRDLAIEVAERLDLGSLSEFDPLLKGQDVSSRLFVLFGFAQDPNRMTPRERVLDRFSKKLRVFAVTETRVITVRFSSKDPALSAQVVNTLIDVYFEKQREAKQTSTREASAWLQQQIEDLRVDVTNAERAVADFRAQSGLLVGVNNNTLSAQQLSELNSQLIVAQTQKTDAQARAQMIRSMLQSGEDLEAASDVVQSELIARLQERLIALRADRAELLSTLLPRHPRVQEIDAEIADLRVQIRNEMRKVARSLESEAQVAGAREAALRANLEALKVNVSDTGVDEVQLRALEREARAQRDLLESLLARFRDASSREGPNAAPADARIISRPLVSNAPASPQKGVVALAVLIAVTLVMAGLVLTRELMRMVHHHPAPPVETVPPDQELRSYLANLDADSGNPPVAAKQVTVEDIGGEAMPEVRQPSGRTVFPKIVTDGGALRDAVSEGTSVGLSSIFLAAPGDGSGARDVAMALARGLTEKGTKTVVVDFGDNPAGGIKRPGLAALLEKQARFTDIIHKDANSRVHVIDATGPALSSLLATIPDRVGLVIHALRETYDSIILSAPRVDQMAPLSRIVPPHRQVVLLAFHGLDDPEIVSAHEQLATTAASMLAYVPNTGSTQAAGSRETAA